MSPAGGPHDQGSGLLREPVHDVRGLDGVGLRSPPLSPRQSRPARAPGLVPARDVVHVAVVPARGCRVLTWLSCPLMAVVLARGRKRLERCHEVRS